MGSGEDPVATPLNSEDCPEGQYVEGEVISVEAMPSPGAVVTEWVGTIDDESMELVNSVAMPGADHLVGVNYLDVCFGLATFRIGSGTEPSRSPMASEGCPEDEYLEGEVVTLTAGPESGWDVAAWRGTDDDTSTDLVNTVTMPGTNSEAGAVYDRVCLGLDVTHSGPGLDPLVVPQGNGLTWDLQPRIAPIFESATVVAAGDIDGDGDVDAIAAGSGGGDIVWWSNLKGNGSFWGNRTVDGGFAGASELELLDMDDDGDLDVVSASASFGNVAWWENLAGDGVDWASHVVGTGLGDLRSMAIADLDDDSDLDIVLVAGNSLVWHENFDGGGTTWIVHAVSSQLAGLASVGVGDLDDDGDLDLAAVLEVENEVRWWKNEDGSGEGWAEFTVGSISLPVEIEVADVDGDGSLDLVTGSDEASGQIEWWENATGDGEVWTLREIDQTFANISSLTVADVNGDGDIDFVVTDDVLDFTTVLLNPGTPGVGWQQKRLLPTLEGVSDASLGDLDLDGDLDILSVSPTEELVQWSKNDYVEACAVNEYRVGDRLALSASPEAGAGVASWLGTEDDALSGVTNYATMPAAATLVGVNYLSGCSQLAVSHSGLGLDPTAAPTNSAGCAVGTYVVGENVDLSAAPDDGWSVVGWQGTQEDGSRSRQNRLSMPASDATVEVNYAEACYELSSRHTGEGDDPILSPLSSDGCTVGRFHFGEVVTLTAVPALGWTVTSWMGTDDDSSVEIENVVTMPESDHVIEASYGDICVLIDFSHEGGGSDPVASPTNSPGCPAGEYLSGDVFEVSVVPDANWEVAAWMGTDDDTSPAEQNSVTVPAVALHEVGVQYVEKCYALASLHTGFGLDPSLSPIGEGTSWVRDTADGGISGADAVLLADLDLDSDLDIVVAGRDANDVLWIENENGSGSVWSTHVIDSNFDGATSVALADFDGDGDPDVVSSAFDDDLIGWWENLEGDASSWGNDRTVASGLNGILDAEAADVDGDGDMDVIGAASLDDELLWVENVDGVGGQWSQRNISVDALGVSDVVPVDLDADGDVDVVASSPDGDDVSWWENVDGTGSEWIRHEVETALDGVVSVVVADLDGDGFLDLAGAGEDAGEVRWWRNSDGVGILWETFVVDSQATLAVGLRSADLDGDGDLDLAGTAGGDSPVQWWENRIAEDLDWKGRTIYGGLNATIGLALGDLDGDFDIDVVATWPVADDVPFWKNRYASICSDGNFHASDRISVLADPDPGSGVLGWSGTEDDGSTARDNLVVMPGQDHEVSVQYLEGCFDLTLTHTGLGADPGVRLLSSDGCVEGEYVVGQVVGLLAAPELGSEVVGWDGSDDDTLTTRTNTITFPPSDASVNASYEELCYPVIVGHIGMGADPVVTPAASPNCDDGSYNAGEALTILATPDPGWVVVGWTGTDDNTGTEPSNSSTMPAEELLVGVAYADGSLCHTLTLTKSGEGGDLVMFPENSDACALGEFNPLEIVTLTATPDPGFEVGGWRGTDDDTSRALENNVTILDGDLLAGVSYIGKCFALETLHTGFGLDPATVLLGKGEIWRDGDLAEGTSADGITMVATGDIDGDGDSDLVGSLQDVDDILWWINEGGGGETWTSVSIDTSFDGVSAVAVGDVDGDGDADVAATAQFDDDVSWFENLDGVGGAWVEWRVEFNLDGAQDLVLSDVDADGDLDIVAIAVTADRVGWWENEGGLGVDWVSHPIATFDGPLSVVAADLDGDGDQDVAAASSADSEVRWWENLDGLGTAWNQRVVATDLDEVLDLSVSDVDGDGDKDLLMALDAGGQLFVWKNDGAGVVWTGHEFAGGYPFAQSIVGADVDGDGDQDAVTTGDSADDISWWENVDGIGETWEVHPVDVLNVGSHGIAIDIDLDGDMDLIGAAENGNLIRSYENATVEKCVAGEFQTGDRVGLTATPDPGSGVVSWLGTEEDDSSSLTNVTIIPGEDSGVTVNYLEGCSALSLSHTGLGADPVATPLGSEGCSEGSYVVGEAITFVAVPDLGSSVVSWSGTDDDTSLAKTNVLTMPSAPHAVSVGYQP